MKRIFYVIALAVVVILIGKMYSDVSSGKSKPIDLSDTVTANPVRMKKGGKDDLLEEIRKNEPSAKEAIITDAGVLYIAAYDNGTSRNGLAEYYCQLASDYSTDIAQVKIVKFGSTRDPKRDNAYGILLGSAWCK